MTPTRRDFLRTSAGALLTAGLCSAQPASTTVTSAATERAGARPTGRPLDILVLLTDQWNPCNVGYERDPDVHTPNLDALAAQSVNFARCYSNSPVCMPARTSLITGLFPHNTGLWGNATDFYLPPDTMPLFSDIRRAGYTTAQVGKFHWWAGNRYRRDFDSLDSYFKGLGIDHPDPIATPFSTADGDGPYQQHLKRLGKYEAYCADMKDRLVTGQFRPRPSVVAPEDHNDWFVANRTIDFLRRQPKDKPYFLINSFPGPHTPLDATGRYLARYDAAKIRLAANVRPTTNEGKTFSLDEIRACRASYLGKITLLDDCIGRIIRTLEERGTWDNTLVIFTSDHGEMMGAQGRFGKAVFWEESCRVPLLIRLPGQIRAGTRSDALVHLHDIHATAVEAAGAPRSKGTFTRSLLPAVRGDASAFQTAAYSEISQQINLNYMVRDSRHKWFVVAGKEQLYDLQEDPLEQRNLIGSAAHRDTVVNLKELQRQFITSTQINLSADYKPQAVRVREALEQQKRKI